MKAGFDFGSKNISYVLLEGNKLVVKGRQPHNGYISGTYDKILGQIEKRIANDKIESLGITGGLEPEGIKPIDPVVASVEAGRLMNIHCHHRFGQRTDQTDRGGGYGHK